MRNATQSRTKPSSAGVGPVIPFTSAAHEHTEPFYDATFTPGATVQNFGPINVPSYGYLRHIWVMVTCEGGELEAEGAVAADYPWNIFASLALVDTNGAPLFGPYDGYAAFVANLVGGYSNHSDPRNTAVCPWYVGTINAAFPLRIPVEISHHDGLGALANQNSAAAYQISGSINTLANMATKAKAEKLKVRVRMFLEAWSLPNDVDRAGRPQAQLPPAHGTTQYWSQSNPSVVKGENSIPITRVGNLIRNIVFITRKAGVRSAEVFPETPILAWDARQLSQDHIKYRELLLGERAYLKEYATGVYVYSYNHSDKNSIGDDNPSLWLATAQSSRLELRGVAAAEGTAQVLVNDVAPGEVIPADRYVETSATGFHPQTGVTTPATQ